MQKSSDLPLEVFAAEPGAPTPVCERTEQVRDGIVAAVSGVSTCGGVTDAHLAAITGSLLLGSAGITSLKEGDFDGLTALTRLELHNNSLSDLPAGVFNGLTALAQLRLQYNSLHSLPAGVFDGLTALAGLRLDHNRLSDLLGLFDGLSRLTYLDLNTNLLTSLRPGVFSGLTSLQTLYLQGNAVDPLPVAVSLELEAPGRFRAVAPTAAPFALTLPVSVFNGEIDGGATTLTIPVGMVHSDSVTVTRSAGSASAVTADIGTLPGLPSKHLGYALEKSSDLPLEVFAAGPGAPTPVCDRTEQVRDAILDRISGVDNCALVTDTHLAAITGSLDLNRKGISALAAGDFDGLTRLTSLDLQNNSLTMLPDDVFDELTALTLLWLGRNSLTTLPDDVFDELTALTLLYLHSNSLTTLPAGVFDELTSLTALSLTHNGLTMLPAGVFNELTSLKYLYLHTNSLDTLSAGVFDNLTALTDLTLGGNSLSGLPAGVFENLTALTDLSLDNNPGTDDFVPTANAGEDQRVAQGAAVTLDGSASGGAWGTNVTYQWTKTSGATVTLSGADTDSASFTAPSSDGDLVFTLTVTGKGGSTYTDTDTATVRVGAASTDATLRALSLSDGTLAPTFAAATTDYTALVENSISTITVTPSTTADAATVEFLDSSDAAITDADTNTDALDASLALGENVIKVKVTAEDGSTVKTYTVTVTRAALPGVCERTEQVRDAIVAAVSGVSACANVTAAHLAAIGFLDLSDAGITSLKEGDFDGLTALTRLDLDNNSLSNLPAGIFDGLTALTDLRLNNNSLSNLPEGVFNGLTALTELHLYNNSLSNLPAGVFDDLTALTTLYLGDNSLSDLPAGVFDDLTALTLLGLGGNSLSNLPAGVFDDLTALTELRLNRNSLSNLPAGVFDGLTALTTLDLNDNSLSDLPAGVFDGLTALTGLGLGNNSLSNLPAGVFDELTALTYLGLHYNSLISLPAGVFDELTALATLKLEGNPGTDEFVPTANAGGDQRVAQGAAVTLDGSASGGAWGTNVTYQWTKTSGATVTLSGADTDSASFTAPSSDGDLVFTLTVTGKGGSTYTDTDTATVRVGAASTDATLSGLAVSGGGTDLLTFGSDTTTYTAMVANDVETLTFSATKSDDGASVAYLDSDGNTLDDADTAAGHQVPLDVGANVITVRVTAEDGTTTETYTVTVTRGEPPPTVTIAADHASFTAVLDQVTFTLTRTGDTAEGLDVSVALTQDKDLIGSEHLAQTVTFRADEATATLNIPAHFFAGNTVTGETALTATVQDGSGYVPGSEATASTRIRVADPAVTASFEQAAYTFDEAVGDATVAVILRTRDRRAGAPC